MAERIEIRPQRGFQERFGQTSADIAIGGGSAGAGKSWALVFEGVRHHTVKGFSGIIFRRTSPELTGGGSLWEEAIGLYPALGGQMREGRLDCRFGSGALVQFRHLQYESDKLGHQGKQYAYIGFDELTHFTETQFWYLVSRNRSVCGVRPYIRATCNPDPDSFVAKLIEWWIDQETGFAIPERSGKLRWFVRLGDELHWADTADELRARFAHLPPNDVQPTSLTFIPGRLDDNAILNAKDPGYRAKLLSMPRVERERLLGGNWKVRAAAGMYFPRGAVRVIDVVPADIVQRVRAWDKAATEPSQQNPDPDWTAGPRIGKTSSGLYVVEHVERFRGTPHKVDKRMRAIAEQDGIGVEIGIFQDPGQAGVVDVAHMHQVLSGFRVRSERPTTDKITYAGPFSSAWEAGNVTVLRGAWNEAYLNELENFGGGSGHDDQVDGSTFGHRMLQRPPLVMA